MPKGIKGFQKGHKFFKGGEKNWFKNGKHYSFETEFKKGHKTWNKGIRRPEISGEKHPNWKGGIMKDMDGYIYLKQPNHPFNNNNGYIFEHRLIMEKHLKRYLKLEERVHHINGNLSDNRIENLKLFPNNSEHSKFHKRLHNKKGQFASSFSKCHLILLDKS